MKNLLTIAGICCILPLIIISIIFLSKDKQAEPPQANSSGNQDVAVTLGNIAPDFQLSDISGTQIRKNDFNKKPVIVWFTASYCVPCQIGAEEVKRLDDDMGGSAFDVVMIFIDPRETEQDLQWWKDNSGEEDWYIAFGNEQIISDYKISYLDTQYLLDKSGVIKNIANSNVGYEKYKELIQPLLE